jgi:hypothetical protein
MPAQTGRPCSPKPSLPTAASGATDGFSALVPQANLTEHRNLGVFLTAHGWKKQGVETRGGFASMARNGKEWQGMARNCGCPTSLLGILFKAFVLKKYFIMSILAAPRLETRFYGACLLLLPLLAFPPGDPPCFP